MSAVSLLTYQVRLEAGTEAGDRHEAVTVSPTEYLGQRGYIELAIDLREVASLCTVKLLLLSSYREETPLMVGPDLGRSGTK